MAKQILTKQQIKLLDLVGRDQWLCEQFYLTGGTALAGFYLHHRYSEDLDFFSEREFDPQNIRIFLKKIKTKLGFTNVDFEQSYNRNLFFLHFPGEVLKTEFTFFPFPRIGQGRKEHRVTLDSLLDIAVNKLFTMYQQTRARDYIDLYFIYQKQNWSISDLIKHAKAKFDWHIDPIQLGTQFQKAEEASDYPRLVENIDPKTWQDFFIQEAGKLESIVIK